MTRTFRFLAAGACALLGTASVAGAQAAAAAAAARPVTFAISGGAAIPTGDAGDGLSTGFIVGGHLGFHAGALPVSFRADVNYARHGFERGLDGNLNVISGFANAVYTFPTSSMSLKPYVLGGLGLGSIGGEFEGESGDRETRFGFQVGAGIDIPLSGLGTFAEIGYQRYNTDGAALTQIPIRFGIRF